MKSREYKSISKPMFCPACHIQLTVPFKGMTDGQFKGMLNMNCGNCKRGKVIINRRNLELVVLPEQQPANLEMA